MEHNPHAYGCLAATHEDVIISCATCPVCDPRCPDCGRRITLLRTGWWTHTGALPNGCWRFSMDGPA